MGRTEREAPRGGVEVRLPRSLRALIPELPGRAAIDASTVAELIDALEARWPGVADRLLDQGPMIRAHINIFVDGERATLSTAVPSGATVHVIPAVAGG